MDKALAPSGWVSTPPGQVEFSQVSVLFSVCRLLKKMKNCCKDITFLHTLKLHNIILHDTESFWQ